MKRDNDDDCEVTHLSLTSFALNLFFWLFSSWETCKTVGANWFLVFLLRRRKNFVPILILSVHFQMITRYLGTQTHNIYHSTEFIREWEKECTQSYEPVFLVLRVGVISYQIRKKIYLVTRHSLTSNNQTRNTRNTGSI